VFVATSAPLCVLLFGPALAWEFFLGCCSAPPLCVVVVVVGGVRLQAFLCVLWLVFLSFFLIFACEVRESVSTQDLFSPTQNQQSTAGFCVLLGCVPVFSRVYCPLPPFLFCWLFLWGAIFFRLLDWFFVQRISRTRGFGVGGGVVAFHFFFCVFFWEGHEHPPSFLVCDETVGVWVEGGARQKKRVFQSLFFR